MAPVFEELDFSYLDALFLTVDVDEVTGLIPIKIVVKEIKRKDEDEVTKEQNVSVIDKEMEAKDEATKEQNTDIISDQRKDEGKATKVIIVH
ncbi:hypothetical protein RJT34_14294 [Clitoria ternatea]|uniref:Uncharacterized protein n=1 Tax=Clitoria ternatea TaxID=43366 RepID=A0AAN9JSC3_CLITE